MVFLIVVVIVVVVVHPFSSMLFTYNPLIFLETLFKPETILTNLLPYTEYIVTLEACNQFTQVSTGDYLFGDGKKNRHLEEVN